MRPSSRPALLGSAALALALSLALTTEAAAGSSRAVIHPSAALSRVVLNYEAPLTLPDGAPVELAPLEKAVIAAATTDFAYLRYESQDDLGGFEPAPIGRLIATVGGRAVGKGPASAQLPLIGKAGKGTTVFGLIPSSPTSTIPARTPTTTVPKTVPTTTAPPAPLHIKMTNSHNAAPLITAVNMAPGDTASDTVVIANAGTVPFTVTLQATSSNSPLASLLQLTISVVGGSQLYTGPLSASGVRIARLGVGQSIELDVALHLRKRAGNEFQNQKVSMDLSWTGQG